VKVAFWNCTLGDSSPRAKVDIFNNWVTTEIPELLLLEEVSFRMLVGTPCAIETNTGFRTINYVNTLDSNYNETTKCLAAFARPADIEFYQLQGRTLTMDGLDQRRALVKVTSAMLGKEIWAIHANASTRGGRGAAEAVRDYLARAHRSLVGGDFNCHLAEALGLMLPAMAPQSHQGTNLTFTQWNMQAYRAVPSTLLPNYHLSNNQRYNNITLNPNVGPIDYLAHGRDADIQKLNNCASEAVWWDILTHFDHCPVVYEINE